MSSNYPLDRDARQALRQSHTRRIVARAQAEAALYGISISCTYGHHADEDGYGCANTGTGCLCQCHDHTTPGGTDGQG